MRNDQQDSQRVYATYFVETPNDVQRAAEVIAGEQSSGTFSPRAGRNAGTKSAVRRENREDRTTG